MADTWELVLHHAYTGAPGVIFDLSPGRGSHGAAAGLADSDFLADGVTPGSGAIDFSSGGRVDVPVSKFWTPLSGLRIEAVCRRDPDATRGGTVVSADTFGFAVAPDGNLRFSFVTGPDGLPWAGGTGGSGGHPVVEPGEWVTVALTYDGQFNFSLAIDGEVIANWQEVLRPLVPPRHLCIGASIDSDYGWQGLIDDVKIWRINPNRIDQEFGSRPVDPAVADCWANWRRRLDDVLRSDPECATAVAALMQGSLTGLFDDLYRSGAYQRPELDEAITRYRQLWAEGRLSEIPSVLADLIAWLRTMGVDLSSSSYVQAVLDNACLRKLSGQLSLDCDTDFVDMINGVAL